MFLTYQYNKDEVVYESKDAIKFKEDYESLNNKTTSNGENTYRSIRSVIGICQSLMCIRDSKSNKVYVETPRKRVKECYNTFKIKIPSEINMSEYMYELYNKVQ